MCKYQTLSQINRNALQKSWGFHSAFDRAYGPSSVIMLSAEAKQASNFNRTNSAGIPLFFATGSFRREGGPLVTAVFKLHYQNHNWLDFAVVDYPRLDLNSSEETFQKSLGPLTEQYLSGSAGLMFESIATLSGTKLGPLRVSKSEPTYNRLVLERIIGQLAETQFRGVEQVKVTLGETFEAFKWTPGGWSGKPSVPVELEYIQGGRAYRDTYRLVCWVRPTKNSKPLAELEFLADKDDNHLRLPKLSARMAPYLFTALEK